MPDSIRLTAHNALISGKPMSSDEARSLLDALVSEARLQGWTAGFRQLNSDEYHEALNDGRESTSECGVHYTVEKVRDPDYPSVWHLTRHKGNHSFEITKYRHPTAANVAASTLNHTANREDED